MFKPEMVANLVAELVEAQAEIARLHHDFMTIRAELDAWEREYEEGEMMYAKDAWGYCRSIRGIVG